MKSELAVAALLVKHIDWKGKVLTGDALYGSRDACVAHFVRPEGVSVSRERQSVGGFLKIFACSLLLPNQQNEPVRGFCASQSSTRRLRREGMGVWTFDGFVCRRNSKAILTGRD